MRRRFVAPALLATMAAAKSGYAEPESPHFSLSFARMSGAEHCSSGPDLARAVERLLGREVFRSPSRADVAIEGYVERSPDDSWRARLSITRGDTGASLGMRDLQSREPTCRELDASVALAIALFIDPNVAGPAPSNAVPPETGEPARAPRVEPKAPPLPATPSRATPADFRTSAQLAGALGGLLPKLAPGVVVRLGLAPRSSYSLTLDAAVWAEESTAAPFASSVGFSLASLAIAFCPESFRRGPFSIRPCAGAFGGVLSSHGAGSGEVLVRHRPLLGVLGRADGEISFGTHWFLGVSGGMLVPTERDRFDYDRNGVRSTIFRPPALAGALDLGIGFRSP